MRIFMTGMAARGIGSTKVRHSIVSLPNVIADALRELGHEVTHQRALGTDVTEFDQVWVQLGWASSLSSTYVVECGLAMAAAERAGIPVVRFVDDWRSQWLADDIAAHVESAKGWHRHTKLWTVRSGDYAKLSDADIARVREAYMAPIRGASLVVPLMRWGDYSKFDVSRRERLSDVVAFDPQPIVAPTQPEWLQDERRLRRWVVASLQDHDPWVARLNLSWPVLRLGGTKKGTGGVQLQGGGGKVIPEAEVIQHYADGWGVLSPEYISAGSGYWRTRYDQAMNAGAIIWPGAADAEAIGGTFSGLTPNDIENMNTDQLTHLGAAMADHLELFKLTREATLAHLQQIVNERSD